MRDTLTCSAVYANLDHIALLAVLQVLLCYLVEREREKRKLEAMDCNQNVDAKTTLK